MEIPFDPSPNYKKGRGGQHITHIVIHAMAGTYKGSIAWFKNYKAQVSAHYLISKKGEVLQMVKDEDRAWHVGLANPFCVGIELEDLSWAKDSKTGKLKQMTCMNDPNWFTPSELDAASTLVAQLMRKHNVPLTRVIGHNDSYLKKYSNNHSDPGPYFPWEKFRAMIESKLKIEVTDV